MHGIDTDFKNSGYLWIQEENESREECVGV